MRRVKAVAALLRKLPVAAPGKARLARFLLDGSLNKKDFPVTDNWKNQYIVPALQESVGFHLLIDGVYEPLSMQFLIAHLHKGSVFIDVGANIGTFTIPLARQIGKTGLVIAVEPSPSILLYLENHIALNKIPNVRIKKCIAWDQNVGGVPFYEAPPESFGMGSCAKQFEASPVSLPAKTLDFMLGEECLDHADVVKVDVEGYEASVFRGAGKLLSSQKPPIILFEFIDWAEARSPDKPGTAQKILRDYGYKLWRLPDYLKGKKDPYQGIMVKGFEMLVAQKRS